MYLLCNNLLFTEVSWFNWIVLIFVNLLFLFRKLGLCTSPEKYKMMKHVHSTSQSRSLYSEDRLRGSDISLTCSSLSEDSVTILDERPGAVLDHGHLARNVWDRYTSGSDLGKSRCEREQKPIEDAMKAPGNEPVCKKEKEDSNVDSTKTVSGSIFAFFY